ncbi:uncharacterized protein UBRO_06623 [Ustilago bromivora]|uniref:Trafficking protein particle complex subunit 12 n=1 Tax=Ustilago bromivora TaxID=307758 RepID=A0A1K0G7L0_9BASI|nr:uncharacterized protein UBRO_06623 [Ustilago bromivora]SYW73806.1 uncharacterized protein UBRO2_00081 [Ustilago bromivora]
MDSTQPYPTPTADPSTSTTSVQPTFDRFAVTPAFARNLSSSSQHTHPNPPQSAPLPHRSIPALSNPALLGDLPNTDPLSVLLQKHIPPHLRPVRDLSGTWNSSSSSAAAAGEEVNEESVQQAAATNSWRKIACLARTQITQSQAASVEEVLGWWSVRMYALARLRLYSLLRSELDGLWHVLEREGLMDGEEERVPFTLRAFRATEPKFRGDVRSTVEQYILLIQACKGTMKQAKSKEEGDRAKIWKERGLRLGLMLAFTLAEAKDLDGAIEILSPLIQHCLSACESQDAEESAHLVLVSTRIYIQAGDLSTAYTLLNRISSLLLRTSPLQGEISHSESLLAALRGDLDSASETPPCASDEKDMSIVEQLNSATVAFYEAKLDKAISTLDKVLEKDPSRIANSTVAESVVFNLATLYELGTQGGEQAVVERKRDMVVKVARWIGEAGISASCFKL